MERDGVRCRALLVFGGHHPHFPQRFYRLYQSVQAWREIAVIVGNEDKRSVRRRHAPIIPPWAISAYFGDSYWRLTPLIPNGHAD